MRRPAREASAAARFPVPKYSTATPVPSGSVEIGGETHDVWCQWDIPLERIEAWEDVMPRLRMPHKLDAERIADIATFVSCVVPTVPGDAIANMRPRRLAALFSELLPMAFVDPFEGGMEMKSQPAQKQEAITESSPMESEPASPRASAGRIRKSAA